MEKKTDSIWIWIPNDVWRKELISAQIYINKQWNETYVKDPKHGYIGIRWMHSELILSSAKKVVNANSDNLALWATTNLQIAINWQYYKPTFDLRL